MDEIALETLKVRRSASGSEDEDSNNSRDNEIPTFKHAPKRSDSKRIGEMVKGSDADSLFVFKRKFIEIELCSWTRGEDLSYVFEEFDDSDTKPDYDKPCSEFGLLKLLKRITEYGWNTPGEAKGSPAQAPARTMGPTKWLDYKQPQQIQQKEYSFELELDFLRVRPDTDPEGAMDAKDVKRVAANDDHEKAHSRYVPLRELSGGEEYDDDDIIKQGRNSAMLTLFWKEVKYLPQAQGIPDTNKPDERTGKIGKDANKENEIEKKSARGHGGSSDLGTPAKEPMLLDSNLFELNLIGADSDDCDELFLTRRTPRDESIQLRPERRGKEEEEEAVCGMTRMTVGEDPLSKPNLTTETAMRRSVATITSVPVALTMSPLGVPEVEPNINMSPLSLTPQTTEGKPNPGKSAKIGIARFLRLTPDLTEKERKEVITRLKKYQSKLEGESLKRRRRKDALTEERRSLRAKLSNNIRKYVSWHKPNLVRIFRKYALLRLGYLDVQTRITCDANSRLSKKITETQTILGEVTTRTVVVDPAFYTDPLAAAPRPSRDERLLKVMRKGVRAMESKIRELMLEINKDFSLSDRRGSLFHVLGCIPEGALKGAYFAPDYDVQAEFDSWLLDARTQEGQQVEHFCSTVANPSEKAITPDDIVLFIDEFVGRILWVYKIESLRDGAKLALLVQRALFPLIYEDVLRMYPEYSGGDSEGPSVRSRDLELLGRLEYLREERHPGIQIDRAFWSKKIDPLVDAEKILAYLPFQLAPPDMIYILQKTVTAICQVGKTVLHRNLVADEIVPLLVHTIVFASPPGLHEALFMMEYLSQGADRDMESGWCIAAFEVALNYIEKLEIKPKK